jgi:hypothetical protein
MPTITGIERLHALVFEAGPLPPLARLRPLVVGRPHAKRRLKRWHADGVVRPLATVGTF